MCTNVEADGGPAGWLNRFNTDLSDLALSLPPPFSLSLIIIMYIYHAVINTLSVHTIHINLNMIFYTHVEHSPTKTVYITS